MHTIPAVQVYIYSNVSGYVGECAYIHIGTPLPQYILSNSQV